MTSSPRCAGPRPPPDDPVPRRHLLAHRRDTWCSPTAVRRAPTSSGSTPTSRHTPWTSPAWRRRGRRTTARPPGRRCPTRGPAAHEAEIDWILRSSVPTIGTAELSRRLRAAGYPLGGGQHRRARGDRRDAGSHLASSPTAWSSTTARATCRWRSDANQAASHSNSTASRNWVAIAVDITSPGSASLRLQKSADGRAVATTSRLGLNAVGDRSRTSPSRTRHRQHRRRRHRARARPGVGYRHYRLSRDRRRPPKSARRVRRCGVLVATVRVTSPMPDRVVHLYRYLVAGARSGPQARIRARTVRRSTPDVDDGIVGPFRIARQSDAAALSASLRERWSTPTACRMTGLRRRVRSSTCASSPVRRR